MQIDIPNTSFEGTLSTSATLNMNISADSLNAAAVSKYGKQANTNFNDQIAIVLRCVSSKANDSATNLIERLK